MGEILAELLELTDACDTVYCPLEVILLEELAVCDFVPILFVGSGDTDSDEADVELLVDCTDLEGDSIPVEVLVGCVDLEGDCIPVGVDVTLPERVNEGEAVGVRDPTDFVGEIVGIGLLELEAKLVEELDTTADAVSELLGTVDTVCVKLLTDV